jgi:hypothetical protein
LKLLQVTFSKDLTMRENQASRNRTRKKSGFKAIERSQETSELFMKKKSPWKRFSTLSCIFNSASDKNHDVDTKVKAQESRIEKRSHHNDGNKNAFKNDSIERICPMGQSEQSIDRTTRLLPLKRDSECFQNSKYDDETAITDKTVTNSLSQIPKQESSVVQLKPNEDSKLISKFQSLEDFSRGVELEMLVSPHSSRISKNETPPHHSGMEMEVDDINVQLTVRDTVPLTIFVGKSERNLKDDSGEIMMAHEMLWKFNRNPENVAYYTGPLIHGGIPHGIGSLRFQDGATFHGPFKNGEMHGNDGIHRMSNGSFYQGGFMANLRHGHGEHIVGSRTRYVGNYAYGLPHGYGEGFNIDGSLFHRGQWENGLPTHAMTDFDPPECHYDSACSITTSSIKIASDLLSNASCGHRRKISRYDSFHIHRISDAGEYGSSSDSNESDDTLSDITGFTALQHERGIQNCCNDQGK